MKAKLLLQLFFLLVLSPAAMAQCFMYSANGNIGPCEDDFTYTYQGEILFTESPFTGTVIIEIDNGTTIYTQAIPAPFTDDTPTTFTVSGIPTDGATTTVTFYFSDDPGCSITMTPYDAPLCECTVDVGSFTPSVAGQSTDPYKLCFGDVLTITGNGDQIPPTEAAIPGPVYDPGYAWLVYSCPPTIAVNPSTTAAPEDDPCMVLVVGGNPGLLMLDDLTEVNNMYWETNYPGVFTDNIVYLVPISMYSMTDLIYSFTNGSIGCYEIGAPFAVQYLPEITHTVVTNCALETVTATITGGSPAVNGTPFTVVPGSLTPAGATFVNTSCNDGGSIVVDNVPGGAAYSFTVEDDNGCSVTISGTMDGDGSATLTYPDNSYCITEPDPSPTVTGVQGGVYTSAAGLSINTATGVVDLSASAPGTYTITYNSGGACPATGTFQMTVHGLPVVTAGPDQTACTGAAVTLAGGGALNYSWNNGVTNNVPFYPVSTQTYTVTGTDINGCQNNDNVTVTITPPEVAQFTADITQGCSPLTVTFTSTTPGSNCIWQFSDGGTFNGCGSIVHTFVNEGCYDVTLNMLSANGCASTGTQADMICVFPDPVAEFTPVPPILSLTDPVSQMVNSSTNAVSYAWTFGDGTTSTATNPLHTFPSVESGSYTVTLIATSAGGCTDETSVIVTVREDLIYFIPNTFTPDGDEFNQMFLPVFTSGIDIYNFRMYIFDRWGEIIFESKDPSKGWDGSYGGKLVQDGAYTWKIEFKLLDIDERRTAIGHVNVIK